MSCQDCWSILFAVCFPPCGVCLRTGCSCDLVINILLTLLGFFPGVLHALYVIGAWSGRDSSRCSHDDHVRTPRQGQRYQHLPAGPPPTAPSGGVVQGYPVGGEPYQAPPLVSGASRGSAPSAPPHPKGKGFSDDGDSKV